MGCDHYSRGCEIFAPCCMRWFGCRHCHNGACDREDQVRPENPMRVVRAKHTRSAQEGGQVATDGAPHGQDSQPACKRTAMNHTITCALQCRAIAHCRCRRMLASAGDAAPRAGPVPYRTRALQRMQFGASARAILQGLRPLLWRIHVPDLQLLRRRRQQEAVPLRALRHLPRGRPAQFLSL